MKIVKFIISAIFSLAIFISFFHTTIVQERTPLNFNTNIEDKPTVYSCYQHDAAHFCDNQNLIFDKHTNLPYNYHHEAHEYENNNFYTNRLKSKLSKHWYKQVCDDNCTESELKKIDFELKCISNNLYDDPIYKNIILTVFPKVEIDNVFKEQFKTFLEGADPFDNHLTFEYYTKLSSNNPKKGHEYIDSRNRVKLVNKISLCNKKVNITFIGLGILSSELLAHYMLNIIYKTEEDIIKASIIYGYNINRIPVESMHKIAVAKLDCLYQTVSECPFVIPSAQNVDGLTIGDVDRFNFYVTGVFNHQKKLMVEIRMNTRPELPDKKATKLKV